MGDSLDGATLMEEILSRDTLNLLGTTQFIDESNNKVTASIQAETRVVVDTENKVSLKADKDAENVVVTNSNSDYEEQLTEEATDFTAPTFVTTEMEFLVAVINQENMILSSDLTINSSNIYGYSGNSYYLVSFLQSFGVDMDMNGYTLTITSPDYSIAILENKDFTFKNGDLLVNYSTGESTANSAFVTYENAMLTLTDVNYSTNASAVLNMDNCIVNSEDTGVLVRGGDDSIEGDDITLGFTYSNCTFDGNVYVGGYNVTINGTALADSDVAGTYDGTTVTYPTPAAAAVMAFALTDTTQDTETVAAGAPTATAVVLDEVVIAIDGASVTLVQ